jgi:hypothetical protein
VGLAHDTPIAQGLVPASLKKKTKNKKHLYPLILFVLHLDKRISIFKI